MDVYITIYRGDTAEDEIEINIEGHYDRDNNSLEILKVVDSFDDTPVELTDAERDKVANEMFDDWLSCSTAAFHDPTLYHEVGEHRDVYWVENEATVVEVEEYETTSEKIVRAQCESISRSHKKKLEAEMFLSDMLNSADPLK